MSIPSGNAYIDFIADSQLYQLPLCTIQQYEQRPEYAADGITLQSISLTITGTSILNDNTPGDLYTHLQYMTLNAPGKVTSVSIMVDGQEFVNIPKDARQGPFMSVTLNELVGTRTTVASFTITASITTRSSTYGGASTDWLYAPVAHVWTQSFSLDAGGLITRTVRGSLTLDIGAIGTQDVPAGDGTLSKVSDVSPYADLFRRVVLPFINQGKIWRRESQTFAVNETGNMLTYEIVDSQARVQLPDGAYSGTADYTYERKRSSLSWATVRFECELEGPVDGDVRRLIWGAVVLAQSRIRFDQCLISRMVVQEMQLLKRARIRFELEAEAIATAVELGPGASTIAVPMAQYIAKNFTMARACSQVIDPYGPPAQRYWAYPHWYDNDLSAKADLPSEIKRAAMQAFTEEACAPGAPVVTIIAPTIAIETINNIMNVGPFKDKLTIEVGGTEQSTTRPIQTVEAVSSFTHVNNKTRMHRLQTLYTEGSDFVFQSGKPVVTINERVETRRVNLPPARVMRPIPTGFVMIEDDWKVNLGGIDADGNRTFTGVYTRTLMAYDGGGQTSNGYTTSGSVRRWWSPSQQVQPAMALGYEANMQETSNSVLIASTTGQGYSVGAVPAYSA